MFHCQYLRFLSHQKILLFPGCHPQKEVSGSLYHRLLQQGPEIYNLSSVITVTLYLPRPNNWVNIKYVQYKNKKLIKQYVQSFFPGH